MTDTRIVKNKLFQTISHSFLLPHSPQASLFPSSYPDRTTFKTPPPRYVNNSLGVYFFPDSKL